MDLSQFEKLRADVLTRLDLDRTRGDQMLDFAKAFAKHVNKTAGTKWVACLLGVMKDQGFFSVELPKVHHRRTLPFTLSINFTNEVEDHLPAFGMYVQFVVIWTSDWDFTLRCVDTKEELHFTPADMLNEYTMRKASELLNKPLENGVDQFVNQEIKD